MRTQKATDSATPAAGDRGQQIASHQSITHRGPQTLSPQLADAASPLPITSTPLATIYEPDDTKPYTGLPLGAVPKWKSYVVLGDSYSEGMMDPIPEPNPDSIMVGWTDRLAHELSRRRIAAGQSPLMYANLAVRGKILSQIEEEQLPRALDLKPDLVSLVGGGNDLIRPGSNPDKVAARLRRMVKQLRAAGIEVLLGTGADPVNSPVIQHSRGSAAIYNNYIWGIARKYGCYLVDQWSVEPLRDFNLWADDHLHLLPTGHRVVMNAALEALGLPAANPDYRKISHDASYKVPVADTAAWMRNHLWPWVKRHSRGHSSGDNRSAKYPEFVPITAEFDEPAELGATLGEA